MRNQRIRRQTESIKTVTGNDLFGYRRIVGAHFRYNGGIRQIFGIRLAHLFLLSGANLSLTWQISFSLLSTDKIY